MPGRCECQSRAGAAWAFGISLASTLGRGGVDSAGAASLTQSFLPHFHSFLWGGSQIPVNFREIAKFLTLPGYGGERRWSEKTLKISLLVVWDGIHVPTLLGSILLHLSAVMLEAWMLWVQASPSKSSRASPTPCHPVAPAPSLSCVPFLSFDASWHHLEVAVSLCLAKSYLRLVLKSHKCHCPSVGTFSNPSPLWSWEPLTCCVVLYTCVVMFWGLVVSYRVGVTQGRDQLCLPLLLSPQHWMSPKASWKLESVIHAARAHLNKEWQAQNLPQGCIGAGGPFSLLSLEMIGKGVQIIPAPHGSVWDLLLFFIKTNFLFNSF